MTVLRLILVPVFVAVYWSDTPVRSALAWFVFALAAATDKADGYLARSRGLITDFGKMADSLADKALVSAALEEFGDVDLTAERNRVARLNQNIADTQKQRSDVLDSIKEKKKTLAAMRQETTELSAECARLATEEREATAERDRSQKEFERLEDAVSQKKKEIEELKERQAQTKKQLTEAEWLFAELSEFSHAPSAPAAPDDGTDSSWCWSSFL